MAAAPKARRWAGLRLWLLAPLLVILLHNVLYFPATEAKTSTARTFALKSLEQRDVVALGLENPTSNSGSSFSAMVAVAEVAPGSRIALVGLTDRGVERARRSLLGFGQADSVTVFDWDAAELADVGRGGALVASGGAGPKLPDWELWLADPDAASADPSRFLVDIVKAKQRGRRDAGEALDLVWTIAADGTIVIFDSQLFGEGSTLHDDMFGEAP